MSAFLYGITLQCKIDIRSKSLLITCYIVPLLFFALMGGIFTSVMPGMKHTLIPSMIIMGVSMGAFIGLPPTLIETYGGDIKKIYAANGVPVYFGLISMFLSAFVHLMIMCSIIILIAPVAFDAALPSDLPVFFAALAIFVAVSLCIGSITGLAVRNQSKITMISQLLFLPSIMLSGIMFPAELLPKVLLAAGNIFPATWGYKLMLDNGFRIENLWYFLLALPVSAVVCRLLLKRRKED